MKVELEVLINKRKNWVRLSKENNFDFDSILAGSYSDPSHFIYEILQNAEDEGAKEVRFELFEDRLDVYHNGKDFDLEDIDGVTGIGISKKKDDLNSIGKFGVGFKSVFAVTETPYIFSGKYKIKIEDFVVPSAVSNNEQVNGTLIRLPFNHKLRSPKEVFTLISKKLENIDSKTLLFLKHIEEIKWQTPASDGRYLKSSESFQMIPNVRKVVLLFSTVTEKYIVIERPIKVEGKNLKVEVAYKLGKDKSGKEIIISEPNSKLFVFFQTEKVTFLNFIIQGPFKTTPNRENIPLEDEQNKKLLEEIGNLVAESLTVVKDLGYLDTNFLGILPIQEKSELIYSVVYDKVKQRLLSDELLPTSDGKYTKACNALLARGKELTEFLNRDDIQELFSRTDWLDSNITYDKTRELRDYLINELGIIEVDFDSFARKITKKFLQRKTDEWMIDFYTRLLDYPSLWRDKGSKGLLRTKEIIRLETGEHIAPFDNDGKVQVYLPTETKTEYKTVKRILTENENSFSLKFLKELGLTKPDLFAEIKEFILPKYQKENPIKDEKYFEDFEKLLRAYETVPANKKSEFIEELAKISFVDSVHNGTGEKHLRRPTEVYFNDTDLRAYFDGYANIYFISDELYEKFKDGRLKPFLIELGVEDKPRRIKIDGNLSWEEMNKLRGNSGYTRNIYQEDYEYEGLDNFIERMTADKSYLLWKLLLKNIEQLSSWEAQKFFKGEYSWFYYSSQVARFDAKFIKTLRQQKWLLDKNNNLRKPAEITFSELSDGYIKESPNIDILVKTLNFKPEIIEQLPKEDRKILEIVKEFGITSDELLKFASEKKKKSLDEKEKWNPECEPGEVTINIVNDSSETFTRLARQEDENNTGKKETTLEQDGNTEETKQHKLIDKKAIGRWGEEYVYLVLKDKYKKHGSMAGEEEYEIIWLNEHNDRGIGYDFVIKKDGSEIEYIEVKTKTQEGEELIEVTGTQWEFARKLFERNEGEKYCFYVVLNAGKENAQIRILKNPIKLWKEGKLYAHPVNFKI